MAAVTTVGRAGCRPAGSGDEDDFRSAGRTRFRFPCCSPGWVLALNDRPSAPPARVIRPPWPRAPQARKTPSQHQLHPPPKHGCRRPPLPGVGLSRACCRRASSRASCRKPCLARDRLDAGRAPISRGVRPESALADPDDFPPAANQPTVSDPAAAQRPAATGPGEIGQRALCSIAAESLSRVVRLRAVRQTYVPPDALRPTEEQGRGPEGKRRKEMEEGEQA